MGKKNKELANENLKKELKTTDNKIQNIQKENTKAKRDLVKLKQREKKLRKQKAKALNEIRQRWYKLDNSALIYPAICNDNWNSVFRLSAVLNDAVNPEQLQKALDLTIDRFPLFNVSLKEGLFWPYFQALTQKPQIQQEIESPCRPFVFKKNKHILRVLYYGNKISLEIFHSLSDGYGATQFFNTLIVAYFELIGTEMPDKAKYGYNVYDKPNIEEGEDSFKRYATQTKIRSRSEKKAYAIEDELLEREHLQVFNGTLNLSEVKAVAKSFDATINEFLSAIYIETLLEHKRLYGKNDKKPIKLSVPVNIRRALPSKTMRNFAIVLNIEIPHEKTNSTFGEIIEIVKSEMKKLNSDYIYGFIGKNVKSERNFLVRILPLFIKKPIMRLVYSQVGEILFTSTISNLGLIKLPENVCKQIVEYQAVLGATKLNRINLAVASINNTLTLSITTRLKDNSLVREFYKKFTKFNLNVKIESNT